VHNLSRIDSKQYTLDALLHDLSFVLASSVKLPYHQPAKVDLSVFLARSAQKQQALTYRPAPGAIPAWKQPHCILLSSPSSVSRTTPMVTKISDGNIDASNLAVRLFTKKLQHQGAMDGSDIRSGVVSKEKETQSAADGPASILSVFGTLTNVASRPRDCIDDEDMLPDLDTQSVARDLSNKIETTAEKNSLESIVVSEDKRLASDSLRSDAVEQEVSILVSNKIVVTSGVSNLGDLAVVNSLDSSNVLQHCIDSSLVLKLCVESSPTLQSCLTPKSNIPFSTDSTTCCRQELTVGTSGLTPRMSICALAASSVPRLSGPTTSRRFGAADFVNLDDSEEEGGEGEDLNQTGVQGFMDRLIRHSMGSNVDRKDRKSRHVEIRSVENLC